MAVVAAVVEQLHVDGLENTHWCLQNVIAVFVIDENSRFDLLSSRASQAHAHRGAAALRQRNAEAATLL